MSILGIYYGLVGLAGVLMLASIVFAGRVAVRPWVAAVLLAFALGASWQEASLRMFAAREPDGMEGLILRPVPYGGGEHDFTPRGEHYLKYAFVVPGIVTTSVAILIGFVALGVAEGRRHALLPLWLAFIGGSLGYVLLALARLIAACETFI